MDQACALLVLQTSHSYTRTPAHVLHNCFQLDVGQRCASSLQGFAYMCPSLVWNCKWWADTAVSYRSQEDSSYNRIKTLVNEELKQYFRPEFLNRLVCDLPRTCCRWCSSELCLSLQLVDISTDEVH